MNKTRAGHMPVGLYLALFQVAHENRMSVAQLQFELLRFAAEQKLGWKCEHEDKDRKWSRKIRMFYCKNCYTFFEKQVVSSTKVNWVPVKPVWERKVSMTVEEWSGMVKPTDQEQRK